MFYQFLKPDETSVMSLLKVLEVFVHPVIQTWYNSNPNLREGIFYQGVVVYLSVVVGLYEVYCTVVSKSAPLYVYDYLEK